MHCPHGRRCCYALSPIERIFSNCLNEDYHHSLHTLNPYWLQQSALNQVCIGNSAGPVINDDEKFAVEVDVKQFHPSELSVNIRNHELTIEGHHDERPDADGHIERHFIRRYSIPDDVNLEEVSSHLSDNGILTVAAKKTGVLSKGRSIPIKAAPRQNKAPQLDNPPKSAE
uniref:SHSP domain-containing protein n=1 Tax=Syphacia muris TaxID=451379 RepID=A0A0N5AH77_9BILA